jgi:hypothetical protein
LLGRVYLVRAAFWSCTEDIDIAPIIIKIDFAEDAQYTINADPA